MFAWFLLTEKSCRLLDASAAGADAPYRESILAKELSTVAVLAQCCKIKLEKQSNRTLKILFKESYITGKALGNYMVGGCCNQ